MDEQLAKALRKLNGNAQYQMPESRNFYFFFNEQLAKSITEVGKTELRKLLDKLKFKKTNNSNHVQRMRRHIS